MRNWVNTYLPKILRLGSGMLKQRHIHYSDKLCSISVHPHEVSLIYSSNTGNKIQIDLFKTATFSKITELKTILSEIVDEYRLHNVPCVWLLEPTHYQLLLMEDLPVEANEFQAAIRWKIKSLLPFPVEESVIDSFPIPIQKTFKPQKMIMVVVGRESYLQPITESIQHSGLQLQTIDIVELALRNIIVQIERENISSAILYLKKKTGYLNIISNNNLYLTRQIDFGFENVEQNTQSLEKLALEIQRSFDFFQSQWRIAAPVNLLFASSKLAKMDIATQLSSYLALPVKNCDLTSIIINKAELTIEQQQKNLPLIGALLRGEVIAHASAD